MTPELKSLMCSDVDLADFSPPNTDPVRIYVEAEIGVVGEDDGDVFGLYLCNLNWIENQSEDFLNLRAHFVVSNFDIDQINNCISELLVNCNGSTWDEVAQKISRHFVWEFEDYTEHAV